MADAPFQPYPQSSPPHDDTFHSTKRRKVIGQCPTCHQTFNSRHELREHMADPAHHAPASDSDAISFGELSSSYDSQDEDFELPKTSYARHDDEPTLESDGFEFVSGGAGPDLQRDGFEFLDAQGSGFSEEGHANAQRGSVNSLTDDDEQPSAEYKPIEIPPARPKMVKGGALGVLYCGTCDKYFGNEKVFKRHFVFGVKHGGEPRDMRDLYYKVWESSWADEARQRAEEAGQTESGRVEELDEMEM
ncbi:hypothetical protein G6514_000005 [Epicoccum nigrum]|nr:hypothetical protein G6514_000005 [Epicoccum nigrum]